jgi:hypothetical protein
LAVFALHLKRERVCVSASSERLYEKNAAVIGCSLSALASTPYIGPKIVEVLVGNLVAPTGHCLPFAVENRITKALEIIWKPTQIKADQSWMDHVLSVAGTA